MVKICEVAICQKKYYSKGLCKSHYERVRVYGVLNETTPLRSLELHGMEATPTYTSWCKARGRCNNPNNDAYEHYGGRGITMCQRWQESFSAFLEDMGERPEGLTLDRIDVNGNYEPSNCRWADRSTQTFNRRKNKLTGLDSRGGVWRARIKKNGKTLCLGSYHSLDEALSARKDAEMRLYGVS